MRKLLFTLITGTGMFFFTLLMIGVRLLAGRVYHSGCSICPGAPAMR